MRTASEQDLWLGQVSETPIDPHREICDPHHHLWHHDEHPYLVGELRADLGPWPVRETVFVECAASYRQTGPPELRPVGETEFVVGQALELEAAGGRHGPRIAGIVGFADLTLGHEVAPVLEAHRQAGRGLFRGVRHAAGWHPSDAIRNSHSDPGAELLSNPSFRRGFAELRPAGLRFDAWLYHHQIPELTRLAIAFPETPIVLDHFGGPLGIGPYEGRRDEVHREWRRDLRQLAACDNVFAKLGGLAMPINGFGWHRRDRPPDSAELAAATRDWYLHAIDRFGPERCMFESNFPVDRRSCSYTVLWNSFHRLVADFTEDEKDLLFRDTARRFYDLA